MPIQHDVTITKHNKALELFTDRFAERRLFANYLHAELPFENIIFFHGDGGNGKSLLLKHLRTHWCKFLDIDDWRKAEHHPHDIEGNKNFTNRYETLVSPPSVYTPIPCIYHDFDREQSGEDSPREAWSALISIRTELTKHKINLPLFDYAIMRYLHHGRGLTKEQIKSKLPMGELSLAGSLIDLVTSTEIPVAGLVVKVIDIFAKYKTTELALWSAKRNLNEDNLIDLHSLDIKSELLDELPQLFAHDLNTAMQLSNSPKRLVLMFDSHESFWGTERQQQSNVTYFQRDEWLRRLLMELFNPNHRITVVIAGREPPRWHEALKSSIPNDYINTQLVGQFGRDDADDYLYKALDYQNSNNGIKSEEDKMLRTALINYAEVEPNQVHPLHLGLAADVVLMAKSQNKTITAASFKGAPELTKKNQTLVEQFLKYCPRDIEGAVIALTATRGFDETLFHSLGDKLHFHHTQATFTTLTGFSFVWEEIPEQNEEKKWYRIHSLLCRRINEYAEQKVQAAHSALESIYRDRAQSTQPIAIVEALYHANQLDWQRGYREWCTFMASALSKSQYDLAEAMCELHAILRLGNEKNSQEHSLLKESGYIQLCRGGIQLLVGDFNSVLRRNREAVNAYQEAVTNYNESLLLNPNQVDAYENKGVSFLKLGDLYVRSSHRDQVVLAAEVYMNALHTFDEVLKLDPMNLDIHINVAGALSGLGTLYVRLKLTEEAIRHYRLSINGLNNLQLNARGFNNKGDTTSRLGQLYADLGEIDQAKEEYESAISDCNEALSLEPDHVLAHFNKGTSFSRLGDLSKIDKETETIESYKQSYQDAIDSYNEVLKLAPNHVNACKNKGVMFLNLGQLHGRLGEITQAKEACLQAINAFDTVQLWAPNFTDAQLLKELTIGFLKKVT